VARVPLHHALELLGIELRREGLHDPAVPRALCVGFECLSQIRRALSGETREGSGAASSTVRPVTARALLLHHAGRTVRVQVRAAIHELAVAFPTQRGRRAQKGDHRPCFVLAGPRRPRGHAHELDTVKDEEKSSASS
jgi:hypothetical protein